MGSDSDVELVEGDSDVELMEGNINVELVGGPGGGRAEGEAVVEL